MVPFGRSAAVCSNDPTSSCSSGISARCAHTLAYKLAVGPDFRFSAHEACCLLIDTFDIPRFVAALTCAALHFLLCVQNEEDGGALLLESAWRGEPVDRMPPSQSANTQGSGVATVATPVAARAVVAVASPAVMFQQAVMPGVVGLL